MSSVFVRGVQSHDAPVRPWRRWARGTRDDRLHSVNERPNDHKRIALGLVHEGDLKPRLDRLVDEVHDLVAHESFAVDEPLRAQFGPQTVNVGRKSTELLDTLERVVADARRKQRDEENPRVKADREAAEREEAEKAQDGPLGRMNSGHRFTGDAWAAHFIDQRRTNSAIARTQAANVAYRARKLADMGNTRSAPTPSATRDVTPPARDRRSLVRQIKDRNRAYAAAKARGQIT